MQTIDRDLGSNTPLYFYFGTTTLTSCLGGREDEGVATFTLKELLDGRKIHTSDDDGLEGWIEIQDGHVLKSWSLGGPVHGMKMPLKDWIDQLKTNGTDYDILDVTY